MISPMTADDERFIDQVWLPMWHGTQGDRRDLERRAGRLLRTFAAAIAEHIRDTSDEPEEDWQQYHELAGLRTPPMPR